MVRGEYEDSLLDHEVWKGRMNGHGKVDAQEEEFQNVIEQTHIPEIEKCPSKDIIRMKEGRGQNFGGIFRVILNVLNLILYVTVAVFFFFFLSRNDMILSWVLVILPKQVKPSYKGEETGGREKTMQIWNT